MNMANGLSMVKWPVLTWKNKEEIWKWRYGRRWLWSRRKEKKKELKERNERQKDRKDNWKIEISGHL